MSPAEPGWRPRTNLPAVGHTDTASASNPANSSAITRAITPAPTDEEAAAIVAAVEALWPRPVVGEHHRSDGGVGWRFSGRWWHRDRFARADRPWT